MPLEVIDFYIKEKVHTTPFRVLVNSASFLICVLEDKVTKGLEVTVPAKYKFSRFLISKNYDQEALKQYNILVDYVLNNKKQLKDKWCLTNKRYDELLYGLRLCLAEKYSKGNLFKRIFIFGREFLRLKFYLLRSKIR